MKNPENEHEELDAETRAIVRAAGELRDMKPSRDLWSGIAARIEAPVIALPVHSERSASRIAVWHKLAIAASLLVVATAGITYTIMKPSATADFASATDSVPSSSILDPRSSIAVQPASLQTAEQTFDREIGAMRTIVDARRKELDPATVLVLEKNLKLIDGAIAESKAALAKDPASAFLMERLEHAYDTKLQLLRGVASIPPRG